MSKKSKEKQVQTASTNRWFVPGISLIILGIIFCLDILAFFSTGGADRSIFDISFSELLNPEITVVHPMGIVGAWLSDCLVNKGIGIMSFVIVWLLVVFGVHLIGAAKLNLKRCVFMSLLVTIWGCVTIAFCTQRLTSGIYPLLGGEYGYFAVKYLNSLFGLFGTSLIIVLTPFFFLCVKFESFRLAILRKLSAVRLPGIPKISFEDDFIRPSDLDASGSAAKDATDDGDNDDDEDDDENEESDGDDESSDDDVNDNDDKGDEDDDSGNQEFGSGDDADVAEERSSGSDMAIVRTCGDDEVVSSDPPTSITVPEPDAPADHNGLDTIYDPTLELSHYQCPSLDLLLDGEKQVEQSEEDLFANKDKIVQTLRNFKIEIDSISATVGPTVTLYEIVPAPGVKISRIQGLENDIAMSLAALGIRIIAPIPGKGAIGIEVPNTHPQVVSMKSVINSAKFQEAKASAGLPIVIGKNISNQTVVFDLAKTPHLLVAGATGQGKSVGLNAIITSILYSKHPSEVKFVLIDPKMVEFSIYKVLEKHFLAQMASEDSAVITDIDKVKNTLQSLTIEMDDRYRLLEKARVVNIKDYNKLFVNRKLNPENGHRFMPYIVVVIDEFADLIMTAGKEVEQPIARIAQKARAVGIHMILATQRPSTNIITGVIKANFPSRIAFKVASQIDSRTILDASGAQHLIGRGDMLLNLSGSMSPMRVQCAFIDTPEVRSITEFVSSQVGFASAYELPDVESGNVVLGDEDGAPQQWDSKIREVALMVVNSQLGSTSNIQRQFSLGYNRAGKIMDQLEKLGIVSPAENSKPRRVYVQTESDLEALLQRAGL